MIPAYIKPHMKKLPDEPESPPPPPPSPPEGFPFPLLPPSSRSTPGYVWMSVRCELMTGCCGDKATGGMGSIGSGAWEDDDMGRR